MRETIKHLVACQWGQYAPFYNNLKIEKRYRLVGCTAIAVAQIMFYWMIQRGFHRGCKATPKYTTATNKFAVEPLPPITVFDWKSIVEKPTAAKEKAAVATLCEYIAKALRSDFLKASTSAKRTSIAAVLNTSLRLGQARQVYEATVGKSEFKRLIIEDLAHGRPVIMTGQSTADGGHSYIIDGYDEETDKFHVNWGWNGLHDGYYAIDKMKPGDMNYNGSKMAVINIEPEYLLGDANGDGKINIADVMTVVNAANSGKATKATDINSDGKVTVDDANIITDHLIKGDVL